MKTVLIEPAEMELYRLISLQRRSHNRAVGIGNRQMRKKTVDGRHGLDVCLLGLLGEAGFGKYFNFFVDLTWEPRKNNKDLPATDWYDFRLNNGKTFDVKTTDKEVFTVSKSKLQGQNVPDYYVMVKTKMPDFSTDYPPHPVNIMGYITPRGIRDLGTLQQPTTSPYYELAPHILKPLTRKQYA